MSCKHKTDSHLFTSIAPCMFSVSETYSKMNVSPMKSIFKVFNPESNKEDAEESFVSLDDSLPDLTSYQEESLSEEEIKNKKFDDNETDDNQKTAPVSCVNEEKMTINNNASFKVNKVRHNSIPHQTMKVNKMRACFKFIKKQFGRIYNFKYRIGGITFRKYRIFTTKIDGKSVKIFIPEHDSINRNINNVIVDFQRVTIDRDDKMSKFHFEISKHHLLFYHIENLSSLLSTLENNKRFILYDEKEKIFGEEFSKSSIFDERFLVPSYTDLKGIVSKADINNLGLEDIEMKQVIVPTSSGHKKPNVTSTKCSTNIGKTVLPISANKPNTTVATNLTDKSITNSVVKAHISKKHVTTLNKPREPNVSLLPIPDIGMMQLKSNQKAKTTKANVIETIYTQTKQSYPSKSISASQGIVNPLTHKTQSKDDGIGVGIDIPADVVLKGVIDVSDCNLGVAVNKHKQEITPHTQIETDVDKLTLADIMPSNQKQTSSRNPLQSTNIGVCSKQNQELVSTTVPLRTATTLAKKTEQERDINTLGNWNEIVNRQLLHIETAMQKTKTTLGQEITMIQKKDGVENKTIKKTNVIGNQNNQILRTNFPSSSKVPSSTLTPLTNKNVFGSEIHKSKSPKSTPKKNPNLILECLFPESVCSKRYHSNSQELQEHLMSHFKSNIEQYINMLQHMANMIPGGRECPYIPCGYHGPVRTDLTRHFAKTHRLLHQTVDVFAKDNNLTESAPYKTFKQITNTHRQGDCEVVCEYCNVRCSAKHLNIHQAMKHFKHSYDQEILTGQMDFGYEAGKCPGPNCEYKAINPASREIMLILHYVQKHKPIKEMAKQSKATGTGNDKLSTKPSDTDQAGVSCPFLDQSFKICSTKFILASADDLTVVQEHVLSHIENIVPLTDKAIEAAYELYPTSDRYSCPLTYCTFGLLGTKSLCEHFIVSHLRELTIYILYTIFESRSELLKEMSRFFDPNTLEFTKRITQEKNTEVNSAGVKEGNIKSGETATENLDSTEIVRENICHEGPLEGLNNNISESNNTSENGLDTECEIQNGCINSVNVIETKENNQLKVDQGKDERHKMIESESERKQLKQTNYTISEKEKIVIDCQTKSVIDCQTKSAIVGKSENISDIREDYNDENIYSVNISNKSDSQKKIDNNFQVERSCSQNIVESKTKHQLDMQEVIIPAKKAKQTARKSTSNANFIQAKEAIKRKIINQENNKNDQIQPPKKKSNLVARKSTAGRLNTTFSREKDYCCTKCHMLFWTPGELYEHTKRKHTKTLLINDEEQNDDIPLHDLTTKEFTNSTDGAAESKDDEIEIIQVIEHTKPEEKSTDTHLKEKYYYFCLDCEEEKGNNDFCFFYFLKFLLIAGEGCRVPISVDIAGHIITKQHTRFTPIENCFPSMKNKNLLSLSNISYSRKWNKKVENKFI